MNTQPMNIVEFGLGRAYGLAACVAFPVELVKAKGFPPRFRRFFSFFVTILFVSIVINIPLWRANP